MQCAIGNAAVQPLGRPLGVPRSRAAAAAAAAVRARSWPRLTALRAAPGDGPEPSAPSTAGSLQSLAERLRATATPGEVQSDLNYYGLANLEDARRSGDEAQDDLLWRTPVSELAARRRGLGLVAADLSTEQERKLRRAVFGFDRWAAHRSTSRYLRHLKGIVSSRTMRALLPPLAFFGAVAVAAGWYTLELAPQYGLPKVVLNDSSLEITSFALSLLLVFRTDSSYARWEQALNAWQSVRAESKNLARQACYFVEEPIRRAMLMRWTVAFPHALLSHVRCDAPLRAQLAGVLAPHEVEAVEAVGAASAPEFVLQVMSELVEQCRLGDSHRAEQLYFSIKALGGAVGTCDKLLRYPIPLAYSRHTSRFMCVWLSALPFALFSSGLGWGAVPVTLVTAYLLLAVDEIGVQIEEPFSILPLEDILFDIQSETAALGERQGAVAEILRAGGIECTPRTPFDDAACAACGALVSPAGSLDDGDDAGGGGAGAGAGEALPGLPLRPRAPGGRRVVRTSR
ncbi:hypothetical protein Rsub_08798 [Raphidocelis subcapitata]|uniref:Uncharacterized protein n=1 Tax=Raphidocelis subcapitata TaxID=307507 RepID=A0A2V0PED1_9CHLO|nr:hypothetical protein Rsub_08798 [Raphidocelis subcapitata]|eukprot:GBF96253.1 hypothetical protein Rsub_08798 [Raphidocelis subcapitata]